MSKEIFLENPYIKQEFSIIKNIENEKIILDKTIFYPTGGGQPCDIGYLQQNKIIFPVNKVERVDNEIIHFIDNSEKLQYGPVELVLDWNRRYKFMRYHSLLHVFAGYLYNEYDALTLRNQIFENRARIDIQFNAQLSDTEFQNIEKRINEIIQDNHQIKSRIINRCEGTNLDGKIKTVLSLIPNNINNIRLIEIENLDEQPCNGTHVSETKEIGSFQIISNKSKGKGKRRFELIINDV
ncbi:alanyl-tRNA editing protein [Bacillus cereus group sp. BfR-BA-01522]|uniref:alanyl-tRNA editing protein n=1 Tax=Bacillus cereus group sp. BfR-BA-01522 TaxID=2920370 RepID=UPI001F5836D0|nr:alanyl-tRNA editing protein [Bacillus cereus group sp. BfR-BA-01522]